MIRLRLGTLRSRTALLASFAVLFQAILFGWHHHELAVASRASGPSAHATHGAPPSPLGCEDDCDICQVLHHSSAGPAIFAVFAPPPATAIRVTAPPALAVAEQTADRAFQARAPPRI